MHGNSSSSLLLNVVGNHAPPRYSDTSNFVYHFRNWLRFAVRAKLSVTPWISRGWKAWALEGILYNAMPMTAKIF